ncbi:MAG: DUF2914 domain-containing protein [Candidatus Thiodiazotropha sp. 6PLUC4]
MANHTQGKTFFYTALLATVLIPSSLWSQEQGEAAEIVSESPVVTDQAILEEEEESREAQEITQESQEMTQQAQELLDSQGIEESPVPDAYVARALFTTEIVNREPVNQVVSLDEDATRILFFTDLRNLQGRIITHRWEFEGEVISEVDIEVGGPRWRAYSVKSLNPGEEGKWTVFVIDESGWPLHASIFQQRAGSMAETDPVTQE